jgi:hypothetical protein
MVTYTSSSTYWQPHRPRIRIYAFSDKSYTNALYTYNAFTDVGSDAKPISLSFDSHTISSGTFSIEIENSAGTLNPADFQKGNRVFIECSKDGSTWQPAFKGLVRSSSQRIFGVNGNNLVLEGYSYLVRLNERIVNTILESALIPGTADYDRTDATMQTNNLLDELLSNNSHYVQAPDDTERYSVFKKNNIVSSPVTEWIPRLDAQLVSLSNAVNRILDAPNGLLMINPADDELMLFTSDLITPANDVFLLTNSANPAADDADYTMYPLEAYNYDLSYDYPDSGSRFIASIGSSRCPPLPPTLLAGDNGESVTFKGVLGYYVLAPAVQFTSSPIRNLTIACETTGNNSSGTGASARVFTNTSPTTGYGTIGAQHGNAFALYVNGKPGTRFPTTTTHTVLLSMSGADVGPPVTVGVWYWLAVQMLHSMNSSNRVHWRTEKPLNTPGVGPGTYSYSTNGGVTWTTYGIALPGDTINNITGYKWKYSTSTGDCGGLQITSDTDPVFMVSEDTNMSNRLGVVERVATGIPTHVKTAQTLNEFLFNVTYFSSKPRFIFDYPSVTIPNKIPKAGDLIAHVDTRTNVGMRTSPYQTGVIASVRYSFEQSKARNSPLGLKRLALTTTGIKRGSY